MSVGIMDLAVSVAVALLARGAPSDSVARPIGPSVIASFHLKLPEAPDAIVPSTDGKVWIVSNAAQAFIQVDSLTGTQSTYKYDKGGASVRAAVAGDDGSLWYLDFLNTETIWRIGRFGEFSALPPAQPMQVWAQDLATLDGTSGMATVTSKDELLPFSAHGAGTPIPIPKENGGAWEIALARDGTIWWTRYGGVDWRTSAGTFGSADFASEPSAAHLRACDGAAATMGWTQDQGRHSDDYRITWIDTNGHVRGVRRWPAPPPPTPQAEPTGLRVPVVGCGLCGRFLTHAPPRRSIGLLACTPSTAWVQIDDSLDWLATDGSIKPFDLGLLVAGYAGIDDGSAFPDAPRVWVYSVKAQRLVELLMR